MRSETTLSTTGGAFRRRVRIGGLLFAGFAFGLLNIAHADEPVSDYAAERQLVIDPEGVRGNWVAALDISRDRKWLAAADGKTVRVWNLDTGQLWSTLRGFQEPHGFLVGTINSVVFSPDGRFLIVGVSDNTKLGSTRVYSIDSPDRIHGLLPGHSGCTSGVAFSPDGRYIATWSCDGTMIVSRWNATQGTTSDPFTVSLHNDPRTASNIEFAYFGFPSDSEFLIHCDGRSVQFVSTSLRRAIRNANPLPAKIRRYFLGAQDTLIDDGRSELNSPITGNLLRQEVLNRACPACAAKAVDRKLKKIQEENPHTIEKLLDVGSLFLGDNDHMTIAGSTVLLNERVSQYWIGVWSQPTGAPSIYYDRHRFFPTAVTVKPELGMAASADALGEIHVWNLNTMDRIHRIRSGALPIYRVVWPFDSKRLLISTSPLPQNQYRYNVAGAITHHWAVQPRRIAKESATVPGQANPVHRDQATGRHYRLRTSPGSGTLQLRETDASNRLLGETTFDIRDFAFAGDGDTPTAFAFLPNAKIMSDAAPIIVGTQRGRLLQVGFRNGQLEVKRVFLGHDSVVSSISISPDGRNFVSSSFDGTVRFWQISNPKTLGDLDAICWGNQVMEVPPGSEAERVGLIAGDKILSFDGMPFYERMKGMLGREYRPGQNVTIRWLRDLSKREPVLAGQPRPEPGPSSKQQSASLQLAEAPDYVKPTLSVFFSSRGEWVVWDGQGRYDASPNGQRFIGFHLNGERHEPATFHRAEQFQSVLYQPRLIDQKLRALGMRIETVSGQPTLAVAPDSTPAAPDQLPSNFADIAPPLVRLTSPDRLFQTDEREIIVEAEVSTQSSLPVDAIRFTINGHSPRSSYRVTRTYNRGDRILTNIEQRIELQAGSNRIELAAAHDLAVSQTARMLIERRVSKRSTAIRPNLYVLAVGVSRYERDDLSLQYAHQDATDFVAACRTMNNGMYGEVECKLLVNEDATSSKIRGAMGWMSRKANDPRDVAILYLAGHGAFDPWDEWFFAPHDIDPENLEQAAIYMNDFEPWLERKIGTSKKIALLDTCHAAGIQAHRNFQPFNKRGVDPWRQQQLMYIVSCVGQERSIESAQWKNGAFTEALLEALHSTKADSNKDGYLSFLEAELYLTRRVSQMTDEQQHPSGKKPLNVSDPPLFSVPVMASPHGPSALVTD
ncbi:MAG: caspase family protein [Rhodopirellula sp. JB044]|uniref:caspase family protein n=1 Tax=Rhodopirellula sp. JB044 TaxID=3342844 RepID=UPI003709CE5A